MPEPLGTDVAGPFATIVQFQPDTAYDSWLTVSLLEGDINGELRVSGRFNDTESVDAEGFQPFQLWSDDTTYGELRTEASALAWIDRSTCPTSGVVAQISVHEDTQHVARMVVRGIDIFGGSWDRYISWIIGESPEPEPEMADTDEAPATNVTIPDACAVWLDLRDDPDACAAWLEVQDSDVCTEPAGDLWQADYVTFPLTRLYPSEYELIAPTPSADRVCTPMTDCGPGGKEIIAPTPTEDR